MLFWVSFLSYIGMYLVFFFNEVDLGIYRSRLDVIIGDILNFLTFVDFSVQYRKFRDESLSVYDKKLISTLKDLLQFGCYIY